MKKKMFFVFLAFILAVGINAQPGGGNAVVSPEISADGAITFRLAAPDASSAVVTGELDGQDHPMTKDESGVWSVTVGPLAPDIYTYSFMVDGLRLLDPVNANTKYGYNRFPSASVVQVPGEGPQFYDAKPVPHGEVRILPYESKTLGVSRTAWIYTPPGYENGRDYPVLYLYHGAGDIESGWTMIGRANNILDNLIAEGKATPMVVVMPLGHAIQSHWTGPVKRAASASQTDNDQIAPSVENDLIYDLIPIIESKYKVSTDPEKRAIGGLSMGGRITMNLGFNHPDLFHSIVIMSSGGSDYESTYPEFFSDPEAINDKINLFWIAVGKDDNLALANSQRLDELLNTKGMDHIFRITEGRHEWTVWRYHLNEFAPLLFK